MEGVAPLIKKQIINYGILLGIASVVFGAGIYITGNQGKQSWIIAWIGIALLVLAVFSGIKKFKSRNKQFLSISEALKIGIGIAMVGALITSVWVILLMTVIEPDIVDQIVTQTRSRMIADNPGISEDQIAMNMEMIRKSATPTTNITMLIITNLFLGLIVSVISGFILKKEY